MGARTRLVRNVSKVVGSDEMSQKFNSIRRRVGVFEIDKGNHRRPAFMIAFRANRYKTGELDGLRTHIAPLLVNFACVSASD